MSSNSTSVVMFQKTLQDLVKGIRNQKKDGSSFISEAIAEIKAELKSTDPYTKAEAVRKLTFLQMIGYNVSWASFAIVEVISQSRFDHKRAGYLAANQTFNEKTDVILLVTNLFKKEFANTSSTASQYEIGLAINCLANIATKDLACDCITDVVNLMSNSKSYIRKKAVIAMYKLYIRYPQGLRLTFEKLKERLDDSDSAVVSCAVNVICELANKNPKNYLSMAPKFFKLLTTSSNNWMLIKVVKLLGSLVCEEPRLARKLLEPLSTIIQNTTAKSLQYECIYTISLALPHTRREDGTDAKNVPAVLALCSTHIKELIENEDPNLKYLGLVALVQLLSSHPRVVVEMRELVLKCLSDDDVTIRTKALELLSGIVSKKTLVDLVQHLLKHLRLAEGAYRDEIIAKILYMGSKEKYNLVTDYIWYVSVLQTLSRIQGSSGAAATHGKVLSEQLMEIALRVDTVRPYAVESMLAMLLDGDLILGQARQTVSEVLMASAWITGEYSSILTCIMLDKDIDGSDVEEDDDDDGYWIEGPCGDEIRSAWRGQPLHVMVIGSLLHPRATNLPARVQSAYVHSAMKIFIQACKDCSISQITEIIAIVRSYLPVFLQSVYLEVQERASTFRYILAELNILEIEGDDNNNGGVDPFSPKSNVDESLIKFEDQVFKVGGVTKQILPVDGIGAKRAKEVIDILSVITAEKFYTVHSKAQRKVPVPEGLNLHEIYDESALSELLSLKDPKDMSMENLYFISSPNVTYRESQKSSMSKSSNNNSSSNLSRPLDAEEEKISKMFNSAFQEDSWNRQSNNADYGDISNKKPLYLDHASSKSVDRNFYLENGEEDDADDNDEDNALHSNTTGEMRRKKKSGKSSSKQKKKSSHQVGHVNVVDMLPAGAADELSSDDDKKESRRKHNKAAGSSGVETSKKRSKKVNHDNNEEEEVLGNIDLTTPLREDEVLPVIKHRETPASSRVIEQDNAVENETKRKKKSGKKHKDEKEKEESSTSTKPSKKDKKHSSEKKETPDAMGDLLGLTWDNTANAPVNTIPSTKSSKVAATEREPVIESSKSTSSKKRSHHIWLPLYSDNRIDLYYSLEYDPSSNSIINITFRTANSPSHSFQASVDIAFPSSCGYGSLSVANGNVHNIARNLSSGADQQETVHIKCNNPFSCCFSNIVIPCNLKITVDSFLGQDSQTVSANIAIPICSFFRPFEMNEDVFKQNITNQKVNFGSASTKLRYSSTKVKKVFNAITDFLHAYEVERHDNKASSLTCRGPNDSTLFALIKVKESSQSVSIDIKCVSSDLSVSQEIANAVCSTLVSSLDQL